MTQALRIVPTDLRPAPQEDGPQRLMSMTLAKETGKALAALERNGKKPEPPPEWVPAEHDYSIKAQLWRQEHMTRSGK